MLERSSVPGFGCIVQLLSPAMWWDSLVTRPLIGRSYRVKIGSTRLANRKLCKVDWIRGGSGQLASLLKHRLNTHCGVLIAIACFYMFMRAQLMVGRAWQRTSTKYPSS